MTSLSCSRNKDVNASDDRQVGGRCEDCEIFYVDMPDNLNWHTTVGEPGDSGEKLVISGVILREDGVTPAEGIILYLYQANSEGYYAPAANQNPASRKHGRLRGWLKTNENGKYKFTTIKPGVYPDRTVPAHIHPIVKEPGRSIYYIDDYVFEGEYKVDNGYREREDKRCGSGIISLTRDVNGTWVGNRNLILGLNVPDYN